MEMVRIVRLALILLLVGNDGRRWCIQHASESRNSERAAASK